MMSSGVAPQGLEDRAAVSPRISVVVPVYEQWHLVPDLLDCLAHQTFAASLFEVILVDNGSKDVLLPETLPANARILSCSAPGSYAARNHGASQAGGDLLVFTDADCLPSNDWLQAIIDTWQGLSTAETLLAGPVDVVPSSQTPNRYEIYDVVRGIPQARYISRGYAATANLAVPRTVFERVGGFDVARFSGGDAEFCRRAKTLGYGLVYVPSASVNHPARNTWQAVATKARRVKGGQIAAGSFARRGIWLAATLLPPLRTAWRLLAATKHPTSYRWTAVGVQFQLWTVELRETFRLHRGGRAERR